MNRINSVTNIHNIMKHSIEKLSESFHIFKSNSINPINIHIIITTIRKSFFLKISRR